MADTSPSDSSSHSNSPPAKRTKSASLSHADQQQCHDQLHVAVREMSTASSSSRKNEGTVSAKDEEEKSASSSTAAEHDHPRPLAFRGTMIGKHKGIVDVFDAIKQENMELVRSLMDREGSNTEITNDDDFTPLAYAVHLELTKIVAYFIGKKANFNRIDAMGWTPLHYAASNRDLETTALLVEAGAELNHQTTHRGQTALQTAAENGDLQIVQCIAEKGANCDIADHEGVSPLLAAAREGKVEVVAYLIKKKAKCDRWDQTGWTPLHSAAHLGNMEMAQLLKRNKAKNNRKTTDERGLMPLHLAAMEGHEEMVRFLVDEYKSVFYADGNGMTALKHAKLKDYKEIVAFLKLRGARDVD